MSYKTNPIANRLKLTKGWKISSFPTTKKNYPIDVLQAIKIYLVLKAYLGVKQIKLINCEIRKLENNTKLIVLNIHRSKNRKIRRKKKSLTKRDVRIKLTKIKYKKAINIVYQNIVKLKKIWPNRFSVYKKHSFYKKWVKNKALVLIDKRKKKKKLDFIKYKRISNRKYFILKNKDYLEKSTSNNWIKSTYFLQKKYKTLRARAIYYKALANSFEKVLKINKNVFLKKALPEKANFESYAIFLKKMQQLSVDTHKNAGRLFMESTVLFYRIKHEQNGFIWRKAKFVYTYSKKCFSNRKKKIKHILRNAKKSLILLKKNYKYRSAHRKDLLKLVIFRSTKNGKKMKKKYYHDLSNLALKSAQLDFHTKALPYTTSKSLKPCSLKYLYHVVKNLSSFKKKSIKNYISLSLFLRKVVVKNLSPKSSIKIKKLKKKNTKYFLKKLALKFLSKKKITKKTKLRIQTISNVLKNMCLKKQNQVKKMHLKHLNIITKFRLTLLISKYLAEYLKTETIVKFTNFIDTYKNMRIKKKIYSKFTNKKLRKKFSAGLKKKQKFQGTLISKERKKLFKTLKFLLKKNKRHTNLKNKNTEKLFKNTVRKVYIKKIKTILKKRITKLSLPSPWEKSEEDIFKRIQQVRAENIKKNHFLSRFIPVLMVFNKTLNAQILADQIAFEFEKTKNHWPLVSSIRAGLNIIRFKKLKGFRIAVSGKINGSSRTRTVLISKGNLPTQSFSERMNFATSQARARTGTFGIRVWLYF